MKKLLLMLFVGMFLISLVGATTYTPSTDTTCNNGVCSKTLYSGIRNVYEDETWKRVEDARSLKDKGFNVIYLEDDKNFPIEIIDFNYTSIKIKLNPKGIKIFNEDVPLRIWKQNYTKEEDFRKDVQEGKKIRGNKDYKEEMDKKYEEYIGFNLLNQEEKRTYDFEFGHILEFGFNSTTIQIYGNVSGIILEDTYAYPGDVDSNGAEGGIVVGSSVGILRTGFWKFNISEIITGGTIIHVDFIATSGGEVNDAVHYVYNVSDGWTEDSCYDIDVNCPLLDSAIIDTQDFPGIGGQIKFDITSIINDSYVAGEINSSLAMNSTNSTGNDRGTYRSKENGAATDDIPYLNITYIPPDLFSPNVTIDFPIARTYNTDIIEFNLTVTDDTSPDTCLYSFDTGDTNLTMSNTTSILFNATNYSISTGNYTVNFYCNDTLSKLNDSESVSFTINWGGTFNGLLRFNENTGSEVHETEGNNGTISGATWANDAIDITLTEDIDYLLSTNIFTLSNINLAWTQFALSYTFSNRTQLQSNIEAMEYEIGSNSAMAGILLTIILISTVLAIIFAIPILNRRI